LCRCSGLVFDGCSRRRGLLCQTSFQRFHRTSDDGTNASGQQPSTGGKKPHQGPGGTDTKNGKHDSGQQTSTGTTGQTNAPGGTDATDETTDSGLIARSTSGAGAPTSVTGAAVAAVPNVVASAPNAAASASDVEPAMNGVAPVPEVVAPVPEVVAPVMVASFSDDMTWEKDMLTLVFGTVVSLTQLQSDLYSFLMGIAGAAPVMEVGGFVGAGLSPAGDASVVSHGPLIRPLAAIQGVPVVGNAIRVAPLGGMARSTFGAIQIGRQSSLPGMAPLVPNDAIPMGEQSFFGYACSELLLPAPPAAGALSGAAGLAILSAAGVLPVSLAALALSALPGAGGLLTLTAAGVRIGYREAKAGFAFRAAGIAGFARPGALGVVRSGSLIVIRPRAVARQRAVRAGDPFQRVA